MTKDEIVERLIIARAHKFIPPTVLEAIADIIMEAVETHDHNTGECYGDDGVHRQCKSVSFEEPHGHGSYPQLNADLVNNTSSGA